MITPQNIKEKTFEKAVFGGYDMASVDNFLDELSSDLELLQKENATLKAKMKVLVEKVEEYRSSEDAIRMAIVSAQRMGNVIEQESRQKADALLADATAEKDRITQEAQLAVEVEKARLAEAKEASAKFVENMELLCNRQLSFLNKVCEMDFVKEFYAARASEKEQFTKVPEEPNNEIHETVKSIEETIAKAADETVSDVRPSFEPSAAIDNLPTKAFNIVTDPEDDLEQTAQFSFDGFEK